MLKKVARLMFSIVGAVLLSLVVTALREAEIIQLTQGGILTAAVYIAAGIAGAVLFYLIGPSFFRASRRLITEVLAGLNRVPASDMVFGSIGLIIGFVIAFLLSQPLFNLEIPIPGGSAIPVLLSIFLYLGMGFLGMNVAIKNRDDILQAFSRSRASVERNKPKNMRKISSGKTSNPKILDTSVIIDARIADIIASGFLDGPIIVPEFVLEELQHIADSADSLRRERGRRGLDALKDIQDNPEVEVVITTEKYEKVQEVDSKLLHLAKDIDGKLVTNDYNLNKVAEVQGLKVLNVNELANALKPVVIPGEEMSVDIIKEGKESNQGLGYLSDGTMIVVENGKKLIGKRAQVVVTSVLQTPAGKMIFVRPK